MLDVKEATKRFALDVIYLYTSLPKTTEAQILGKQMLRSATSVGAQYRESQRAKSDADFISKIEGRLQEADETLYWFELLCESGIIQPHQIAKMKVELDEIIRVMVAMVINVKKKSSNIRRVR
jgi:four helix bundle protein